jgi:tellurite resistance protein TerA
MSRSTHSGDALSNASKSQARESTKGGLGAGGMTENKDINPQDMLDKNGESGLIPAPENGFDNIHVGLAWNNVIIEKSSGFMGLVKKATKAGVDLDLGCFFELQDGTRGVLQPFGDLFGHLEQVPYIHHHGDERTGDSEGDDEVITINGKQWPKIKRVMIYTYIYQGGNDWSQIEPEINIDLKTDDVPIHIQPKLKTSDHTICALASIRNVKNAIQIVTHGEYFMSQAAMDRAFGFGLEWDEQGGK